MKITVLARALTFTLPVMGALATSSCGEADELIDAALRDEHGEQVECPNICEAICAGEPEPETPPGCPIPQCLCE